MVADERKTAFPHTWTEYRSKLPDVCQLILESSLLDTNDFPTFIVNLRQ